MRSVKCGSSMRLLPRPVSRQGSPFELLALNLLFIWPSNVCCFLLVSCRLLPLVRASFVVFRLSYSLNRSLYRPFRL